MSHPPVQANNDTPPAPANDIHDGETSSAPSTHQDSGTTTPLTLPSQSSQVAPGEGKSAKSSPIQDVDNSPRKTPFERSVSNCKPLVRPALTDEQSKKYDTVLATVSGWKELPKSAARNSPSEPLSDDERMWLTRECILRYLRASAWSTTKATQRLQQTLTWRREYGVARITADYISIENETGKQVILGYDNNARPCLYMSPGRQNTEKSDRQLEHLVFMLERVVEMMEPGQETTALLINFKNSTSGGSPSVSQGKQTLNILQGHYPERLGRALISDLPWYITTFFKLISPFIDPVTKEKMIFNQDLRKYVPPEQLDKEHGGDVDFVYDHAVYWPALNKTCDERRAAYKERWIQGGKMIGEYEAYLRGGEQKSLSQENGVQV